MNPSRKAIVLVDDEKAYIDLIAHLLTENLGCKVIVFYRPLDALAALPTLDVACVVSDFHMPDINGYEFIRRGAVIVPDAKFILISGHAVHLIEDRSEWPAAVSTLLAKPFSWRTLAHEISMLVPEFTPRLANVQAGVTAV